MIGNNFGLKLYLSEVKNLLKFGDAMDMFLIKFATMFPNFEMI